MKSGILISLLLHLSLLIIHQAQGMGLVREGSSQQFMSHKTHEEKSDKNVLVEEVSSVWKSIHFSGRARKLMITTPIPTTATITKNENNKNKEKSATKEEKLSVHSSSTAEQRQEAAAADDETYPGILDIAGMDYSQARRKPPIHN